MKNSKTNNDGLTLYLKNIARYDLLTADQEKELAREIKAGSIKAKNKMIEANLRLVVKVAKSFAKSGGSMDEFIQEGNTGLIKAVERFDPDLGYRFSTYAIWWIRLAIDRHKNDTKDIIRLPVHVQQSVNKIFKIKHKLASNLGRVPSDLELSEAADIPIEKLNKLMQCKEMAVSGNEPLFANIGSEANETLFDTIPYQNDENSMSEFKGVSSTIRQDDIKDVVRMCSESLDKREYSIMCMRYGIGVETKTLEEISKVLNVSRERVRQIQKIATAKITASAEHENISESDIFG